MANQKLLSVTDLQICIHGPAGRLYPAVDGVSFDMLEGEILALVGESGCGKSLTALAIDGLLDDDTVQSGGSISFCGKELSRLTEREKNTIYGKDIGMVFQEPMTSLDPLMRIGKQVGESLQLHRKINRKERDKLVEETLASVKLENTKELMQKYPHELSGGMRQRVMIASASILRPRLLIADEPTTALDLLTQEEVVKLLKAINADSGTAILFISHDLKLVSQISDRTAVMYAGKIVEIGHTDTIIRNPAHPYTRALLDSVPSRKMKGRPLGCISGRVPTVTEPKPPCPFAPRCPLAKAECFDRAPQVMERGEGHRVCCNFPI